MDCRNQDVAGGKVIDILLVPVEVVFYNLGDPESSKKGNKKHVKAEDLIDEDK